MWCTIVIKHGAITHETFFWHSLSTIAINFTVRTESQVTFVSLLWYIGTVTVRHTSWIVPTALWCGKTITYCLFSSERHNHLLQHFAVSLPWTNGLQSLFLLPFHLDWLYNHLSLNLSRTLVIVISDILYCNKKTPDWSQRYCHWLVNNYANEKFPYPH